MFISTRHIAGCRRVDSVITHDRSGRYGQFDNAIMYRVGHMVLTFVVRTFQRSNVCVGGWVRACVRPCARARKKER